MIALKVRSWTSSSLANFSTFRSLDGLAFCLSFFDDRPRFMCYFPLNNATFITSSLQAGDYLAAFNERDRVVYFTHAAKSVGVGCSITLYYLPYGSTTETIVHADSITNPLVNDCHSAIEISRLRGDLKFEIHSGLGTSGDSYYIYTLNSGLVEGPFPSPNAGIDRASLISGEPEMVLFAEWAPNAYSEVCILFLLVLPSESLIVFLRVSLPR